MKQFSVPLPGILLLFLGVTLFSVTIYAEEGSVGKYPIIFVTHAEYEGQIFGCLVLAESIRSFAGPMSQAPIWVYISEKLKNSSAKYRERFAALSVELKKTKTPKRAQKFLLGGKPFAAAQAEAEAEKQADFLALLAPNTIVIKEPGNFRLPEGKNFAYSPVHHQNIGSLYARPPDTFWKRLYKVLDVPGSAIFSMKTMADNKIIRPYFNAGSLVVRPGLGILRKWAQSFEILYQDLVLAEMCKKGKYNTFLHQAALAGTAIKLLEREEMILLSSAYNYPVFFDKFYDAELKFDSIEKVITLRYEFSFRNLPGDWDKKLKGPVEIISWIKARFSTKTN